jgi:serine/threonine-protein kinase
MIGQTISHYKILEKLGEGGMGVVYKAHDIKLDRYVALKFLPRNITASQEEIIRFEQEARAISALNHPNIETIHDVDEVNGQKYLVLEYIPGGTLKSKLKQLKSDDKEFSITEVLDYGIQIADGLSHAHRHQIIHRDVKTDNMMLTEEGKVKLTDFGLAKLRGTVNLTRTGSTVGTAAYMSPEQIRGEDIDHRSDIFSLGVVWYELVTSHLPFRGDFEAALSYSILHENPQPIKLLRSNVSQSLEQIINSCLEKDKIKRCQSTGEVIDALRKVQREISGSGPIVAKQKKVQWIIAAVVVFLTIVCIFLFYPRTEPKVANSKTIAVLPFRNMSDSKEDQYFADGITEDIITQLSKIADLKVISRTSIMQYKGTSKNILEIGKELNVGTVLEGSVRRAGNQVRIVAQLIDAQNEGHIWAETYDKELIRIFEIQSDVAQKIATALKAKLLPVEKERIEKKQTESMEAYQFYLKGMYHWNKRTAEELKKAIEYFNLAIKKDPNYALAYAGLASTYILLPEYALLPAKECLTKAETSAKRALEIDKNLAEAHAVLGLKKTIEWDWEGAESEYKKAIELNPNYSTTHLWYYNHLSSLCRFDEALSEIKRAQELDPLSLVINMNIGEVLYRMRQFDKAIDQFKKTIDLDPNYPFVLHELGWAYTMQGRLDEALEVYQKARTLLKDSPLGLSDLGYTYALAGRKDDAQKVLKDLFAFSKQGYSLSGDIAFVYYGLGNKEKTFEWLEKAYRERNVYLVYMKGEPRLDNLRSDTRFTAILKKMGMEK